MAGGRREMEEVQCSLPHFTCVTARTTDQNVYLAWSTKLYLVDGGMHCHPEVRCHNSLHVAGLNKKSMVILNK